MKTSHTHIAAVLATAAIALVALTATSWHMRSRVTAMAQQNFARTLTALLETSHQALDSWSEEHMTAARMWAETETVEQAALALLDLRRDPQALLDAPAQREMRAWFESIGATVDYQGFFIISRDLLNLASSRDENVGVPSLLVENRNYFNRIWDGQAVMSAPTRSDVPLLQRDGTLRDGAATMFIGAPVRDASGTIRAALVLRLDPTLDFTEILQQARFGESGETYGFDRQGRLISNSRFDDQLQRMGLLAPGEPSILNIKVREIVEVDDATQTVEFDPEKTPPFLISPRSADGETAFDVIGYPDYRGIDVIGAWLWDPHMDIGLVTEIDVDEAYAALQSTLLMLDAATGLGALFVLLLAAAAVFLIRRRSRFDYELREREKRAVLLKEIAVAANEVHAVDEALQAGLDRFCEICDWPVGHVYFPQSANGEVQLLPSAIWHVDDSKDFRVFRDVTARSVFAYGKGLPGRVYASKASSCIYDVTKDPEFARTEFAQDLGVRGAFAVPVMCDNEVAAVLEFFSRVAEFPDANLLDTMTQVGSQLGIVMERKRSENQLVHARLAAEESNRSKVRFLANMSHQLRTPLNPIIGFSQILMEKPDLAAEERDMLETVRDSGKHLLAMVDDLMEMVKLDAGKVALSRERVSVTEFLSRIDDSFRPAAREKALEFNVKRASDVPDFVEVDREKLWHVLTKLLENAIRFTDRGEISVKVTALEGEDSRDYLLFSVRDTGPGISPEDQQRVFNRFEQSAIGSESGGGAGIGLSLSRDYIRAMGGDMTLWSKIGCGSVFDVRVPVAQEKLDAAADNGEPTQADAAAHDSRESAQVSTVLLSQIAKLPDSLVGALQHAAENCAGRQMETLVLEVENIDPNLAAELRGMAAGYEYERLIELIESGKMAH